LEEEGHEGVEWPESRCVVCHGVVFVEHTLLGGRESGEKRKYELI
jgi:hypothetical protein